MRQLLLRALGIVMDLYRFLDFSFLLLKAGHLSRGWRRVWRIIKIKKRRWGVSRRGRMMGFLHSQCCLSCCLPGSFYSFSASKVVKPQSQKQNFQSRNEDLSVAPTPCAFGFPLLAFWQEISNTSQSLVTSSFPGGETQFSCWGGDLLLHLAGDKLAIPLPFSVCPWAGGSDRKAGLHWELLGLYVPAAVRTHNALHLQTTA